jgi:hypothetical protein
MISGDKISLPVAINGQHLNILSVLSFEDRVYIENKSVNHFRKIRFKFNNIHALPSSTKY